MFCLLVERVIEQRACWHPAGNLRLVFIVFFLFVQYCPLSELSVCVFGMNPFYGLCSLHVQDSCVVLLSKAQEPEKEREDPIR